MPTFSSTTLPLHTTKYAYLVTSLPIAALVLHSIVVTTSHGYFYKNGILHQYWLCFIAPPATLDCITDYHL